MAKTKELVESIVRGIQEKKGAGITVIDLSKTEGSICQSFVICQGNSPMQTEAIADSVEETVRKETSEKPLRVAGRENALWIAMDYVDVLVHIFVPDMREFYHLEDLWQDAPTERIADLD